MLSICQLHLQLPFDDCPTVAAADVDSVTHCRRLLQRQWDSRRMCVCAITVSLLTIMIRGSYVSYSFPLNTPLGIIVSLLRITLAYVTINTALKIMLTQSWEL